VARNTIITRLPPGEPEARQRVAASTEMAVVATMVTDETQRLLAKNRLKGVSFEVTPPRSGEAQRGGSQTTAGRVELGARLERGEQTQTNGGQRERVSAARPGPQHGPAEHALGRVETAARAHATGSTPRVSAGRGG